jgi:hypothetical protein
MQALSKTYVAPKVRIRVRAAVQSKTKEKAKEDKKKDKNKKKKGKKKKNKRKKVLANALFANAGTARKIAFIIDVSGSMDEHEESFGGAARLEVVKRYLVQALKVKKV